MKKGKVYLVGAGPGDAGLITVNGMNAIKKADVIVYDRLANPKLLKYNQKSKSRRHTINLLRSGWSSCHHSICCTHAKAL